MSRGTDIIETINRKARALMLHLPHCNPKKITIYIGVHNLRALQADPRCHEFVTLRYDPGERQEIAGLHFEATEDPDHLAVVYEH